MSTFHFQFLVYKATNTKILEAESGVISLNIYLDQITLKSRDKPRCSEIIKLEKTKIRGKLSNKKGRKCRPRAIPMAIKDTWTWDIVDKAAEAAQILHQGSQTQFSRGNIIKKWAKEKWKERWEEYLNTVTSMSKTPAHHQDLGRPQDKLYQSLRKSRKFSSNPTSYQEGWICSISLCL